MLRCEWRGCESQSVGSPKQLAKHLSQETHIGQTPFLSKHEEQVRLAARPSISRSNDMDNTDNNSSNIFSNEAATVITGKSVV